MNQAATTVVNLRRTQEYDRRVDRKSRWGNRASRVERDASPEARAHALREYGRWLAEPAQAWILDQVGELAGERLACWCSPSLCHGHVLAMLADGVTDDPAEAAELAIDAWKNGGQTSDSE